MKTKKVLSGCMGCGVSRREFIASGCAACAAGLFVSPDPVHGARIGEKMTIRVIYALHAEVQPGPDWPNVGFDFRPAMKGITAALRAGCPGFEFITAMAKDEEEAKNILADDASQNVGGYIVYQMNCWQKPIFSVADTGKPVLFVDFQYGGSGGFLVYTGRFLNEKWSNFAFVASSKTEDLIEAVKCFDLVKKGGSAADFSSAVTRARIAKTPKAGDLSCLPDPLNVLSTQECLDRMAESKILALRDQNSGPAEPVMGIPVEWVAFEELNAAWKAADKEESKAIAERWQENANSVVDVSPETLEQSAAMYLAQKAVMKKHGANAITINCLGGFYGGHIHAYPCLGFHQLANDGLVGACECDIRSTAVMTAFGAMTHGRPGYISDPVIDTSKRQIIYAHCVAGNKAFGPEGPTNPYHIMTHSEDRQGASLRSLLPLGYMTTTLEIANDRKEILFHQGKTVANDPDDRACRTKIAAEPVGDMEKLFTMWGKWGWHRVTFYGDLKEPVFALADAMGWKVIEEA
jgi:hypothetical protein